MKRLSIISRGESAFRGPQEKTRRARPPEGRREVRDQRTIYLLDGHRSRASSRNYGLMGTVKLNHRDPDSNLAMVLSRIADHPVTRIGELLPWNLDTDWEPLCEMPAQRSKRFLAPGS